MRPEKNESVNTLFHEYFEVVTGGDGRPVYDWLVQDYRKQKEPSGHFYHTKDLIAGHFVLGTGLYFRRKDNKRLVGYCVWSYHHLHPISIELEVIEVLSDFRRQGIAKLAVKYLSDQIYPNAFVITGSPIKEAIPIFSKWASCTLVEIQPGYQRLFMPTKPVSDPTAICPNGFAISIDNNDNFFPISVKKVTHREDSSLPAFENDDQFNHTYSLDMPVLVQQTPGRNYEKEPILVELFYNMNRVGAKTFKENRFDDKIDEETWIYISNTCICITYLCGEIGTMVSQILSDAGPTAKRSKKF